MKVFVQTQIKLFSRLDGFKDCNLSSISWEM